MTSSLLDPRSKMLTFLTSYLTTASITEDNGTDVATVHKCYSGVKAPLSLYFFGTKNNDVVYTVEVPQTTALTNYVGALYAYREAVPIQVSTVDKTGITGEILLWKAVRELRYALEVNWTAGGGGSFWTLTENKPSTRDMGGWKLYSQTLTVNYKRSTDIAPTYPSITYGDNQGSTYTFPNCVSIRVDDADTGDAYLAVPGRVGDITQILGSNDFEVTLTCDLEVEPAGTTWKRPQATTPKTDYTAHEVFMNIKYGGKTDSDQTFQTLKLGYGTGSIPVRLVSWRIESTQLEVTFRRYSATAAATYQAYYGVQV